MSELIKLNLGSGAMDLPGYINIDLYDPTAQVNADVRTLPFKDDFADEIYSSHVIEHFHFHEGFKVLREWYRVLKPGGNIIIETPDLLLSCKKFAQADEYTRISMYAHLFGMPWIPGGSHLFLYTENQLRYTLNCCGFTNITKIPAPRYIGKEDICLGMKAYK